MRKAKSRIEGDAYAGFRFTQSGLRLLLGKRKLFLISVLGSATIRYFFSKNQTLPALPSPIVGSRNPFESNSFFTSSKRKLEHSTKHLNSNPSCEARTVARISSPIPVGWKRMCLFTVCVLSIFEAGPFLICRIPNLQPLLNNVRGGEIEITYFRYTMSFPLSSSKLASRVASKMPASMSALMWDGRGLASPRSHIPIVTRSTSIISANFSWDSPAANRPRRITNPKSFSRAIGRRQLFELSEYNFKNIS